MISIAEFSTYMSVAAAESRAAYVAARRKFEEMLTGQPSTWGEQPIPKWDGGERDRSGRRNKPVWGKLAHAAISNGLTPAALVYARFEVATGARAPTPDDCVSQQAVSLARSRIVLREDRLVGRLASDRQAETTAIGKQLLCTLAQGRTPTPAEIALSRRKIVDLPSVTFSPIYRYGLSKSVRLQADPRLLIDAVRQYLEDPEGYDRVWGEFVDSDIRSAAHLVKQTITKGVAT